MDDLANMLRELEIAGAAFAYFAAREGKLSIGRSDLYSLGIHFVLEVNGPPNAVQWFNAERELCRAAEAGARLGLVDVPKGAPVTTAQDSMCSLLFDEPGVTIERKLYLNAEERWLRNGELVVIRIIKRMLAAAKNGDRTVEPTDLITQVVAAELLGCDVRTVRRRVAEGRLATYGPTGQVSRSEVELKRDSLLQRRPRKKSPKKPASAGGHNEDRARTQGRTP
jgi:hypothetical protein